MDPAITNGSARADFARITSRQDAPFGEISFATRESAPGVVLVARSARDHLRASHRIGGEGTDR
jgi:hypothetical protein